MNPAEEDSVANKNPHEISIEEDGNQQVASTIENESEIMTSKQDATAMNMEDSGNTILNKDTNTELSYINENNSYMKDLLNEDTYKRLQKFRTEIHHKEIENNIKPEGKPNSDKEIILKEAESSTKDDVAKLIWPCMIFQVLVTEKQDDRLIVELKELSSFCYDGDSLPESKYEYDHFKNDILKNDKALDQLQKIYSYHIKGQIKKYDIDETNPMPYFISFFKIRVGDMLTALVKRKEDSIVCLTMKNKSISGCRQRKFEDYYTKNPDYYCFFKLGYTDLEKKDRNVLEIDPFFEQDLKLPNKNLFDLVSANYAEYGEDIGMLGMPDSNITFNYYSNRKIYAEIGLEYQKIRESQNKVWALESLNQGIELTQHKHYSEAIAFFDNAISMDETLTTAYIAKGCALSNLEKYHEGLKLLDKALEIEPENESAQKYKEAIINKIKEKEKEIFRIDDRNKVTLVRTKKVQEKESYNTLLLDDDESEGKSKKSKKKRSKRNTISFVNLLKDE